MAKIVGGSDASPQEAPWFVMILTFNPDVPQWEFSGCSGVLLSNVHVLTAGHCAKGRDPANDGVFVHAYQPFWGNPNLRFHFSKVQSYTINPNFDDGPNKSDTAIITMKKPLDLEDFDTVDLARPSTPVQDGDTVNVYGFGRLSESGGSSVKTLQRASMPYISGASCQDYYPDGDVLEDMFCAGDKDGGRDACSGDSGGPLIKQVDGTSVVLGLVSWGDGCGRADKPGVYTSVQYHYDWIRNTVCDDPNVDISTRLCSDEPSLSRTTASSTVPSSRPSAAPSSAPSRTPSSSLLSTPSSRPSAAPSWAPSSFLLYTPTSVPTSMSTLTMQPTTASPTRALTLEPTSGNRKGRSGDKKKKGAN
jgi:secreted trypsin-like serine protease